MDQLTAVVLLLLLYGGAGLAAVVMLALAFRSAKARSAVIAIAIVVSVLLMIQALGIWLLGGMARAWGGDTPVTIQVATVLFGLGVRTRRSDSA